MAAAWQAIPDDLAVKGFIAPVVGTRLTADEAMQMALQVALQGSGFVSPNPLVGAVVVDKDHGFLAMGAHRRYGGAHAEIVALNALKEAGLAEKLAGATMYVTLEPCAHHGKTPPCAVALGREPLAKVVYAVTDPNPLVAGKGAAILGAAGIEVECAEHFSAAARTLCEAYFWAVREPTPFVGLKVATTLDGTMARSGDQKQWLTGERARAYGHYLRLRYDAVLVGQRTLILDDPSLDPRQEFLPYRPPWRVVLDPDGKAAPNAAKFKIASYALDKLVWVSTTETRELDALRARGATVLRLPPVDDAGAVSPPVLLTQLKVLGIQSLLLEGGAGVYGSFLAAGAVQKLHLFQGPKLFGGSDRLPWAADFLRTTSYALTAPRITPLDDDWVIEANVVQA